MLPLVVITFWLKPTKTTTIITWKYLYKVNGNIRILWIQLHSSIRVVQALIQDRDNIPVMDQVLSYRGRHLADEGSLVGYNT